MLLAPHPPRRGIPISVFFPAHNEAANIKTSVLSADAVLSELLDNYEIIVVNDGSTDETGLIADELARNNERVRAIHHSPNQGYGAALISGIRAARHPYVFFTDADLQFDIHEIERLLGYIPEYDAVLGYRVRRHDSIMRRINAKGWNMLNRILLSLKVRDIDCAFKLLNRNLAVSLAIESRSAMTSAEMLILLKRHNIEFKEVPVTQLPRKVGSATGANLAVAIRAVRDLISLFFHRPDSEKQQPETAQALL